MKKLFESRWINFFLGVILGLLVFGFAFKAEKSKENIYFRLKKDYCIDNYGYLKSGTILKVDEGMSEGFTRYILYLNISDAEEVGEYTTKENDMIIPYWLRNKEGKCP